MPWYSNQMAQKISPIGIANCGIVEPWLFRGAQPDLKGTETTESGIESLFQLGVKKILDFRSEDDDTANRECLEAGKYGIQFVRIPIANFQLKFNIPPWQTAAPSVAQAKQILAELESAQQSLKSVFMHCKYGHDRTGAGVGLYRRQRLNWSFEDTLNEMVRFGFNPGRHKVIYDWVKSLPLKEIG